ncbi:MAG: hypothetical protein ACXW2Y_00075 [Acidimicrobiia bacterium]
MTSVGTSAVVGADATNWRADAGRIVVVSSPGVSFAGVPFVTRPPDASTSSDFSDDCDAAPATRAIASAVATRIAATSTKTAVRPCRFSGRSRLTDRPYRSGRNLS